MWNLLALAAIDIPTTPIYRSIESQRWEFGSKPVFTNLTPMWRKVQSVARKEGLLREGWPQNLIISFESFSVEDDCGKGWFAAGLLFPLPQDGFWLHELFWAF